MQLTSMTFFLFKSHMSNTKRLVLDVVNCNRIFKLVDVPCFGNHFGWTVYHGEQGAGSLEGLKNEVFAVVENCCPPPLTF